MKIVVAGFPKTGTKSMDAALTQLGYKVYGYLENMTLLEQEWTKMLREGGTAEDFKRMYDDVDAVTDLPACFFWEELLEAFPDSKIILTVRENEDQWLTSLIGHLQVGQNNLLVNLLKSTSPTQWRLERNFTIPSSRLVLGLELPVPWQTKFKVNSTVLKKNYKRHNSNVQQNAPKDKLLVYKISEGWDPLCKFLEVPVPDKPFPHKNKRGGFFKEAVHSAKVVKRMKQEMYSVFSILGILVALGIYKIVNRKTIPPASRMTEFVQGIGSWVSWLRPSAR